MTQANPSAGLVGSVAAGLTDAAAAKPRPRLYQTWARVGGNWICVFAAPTLEPALQFARDQIRHGDTSAATCVQVRALSDDGVAVCWSSE